MDRVASAKTLYLIGKSEATKAAIEIAHAWTIQKLEMVEFEPRDRLTLWAFLDLVMSHPFRSCADPPPLHSP